MNYYEYNLPIENVMVSCLTYIIAIKLKLYIIAIKL